MTAEYRAWRFYLYTDTVHSCVVYLYMCVYMYKVRRWCT